MKLNWKKEERKEGEEEVRPVGLKATIRKTTASSSKDRQPRSSTMAE
jgi:hypothetical protein